MLGFWLLAVTHEVQQVQKNLVVPRCDVGLATPFSANSDVLEVGAVDPVSYTHLDVYKRQSVRRSIFKWRAASSLVSHCDCGRVLINATPCGVEIADETSSLRAVSFLSQRHLNSSPVITRRILGTRHHT